MNVNVKFAPITLTIENEEEKKHFLMILQEAMSYEDQNFRSLLLSRSYESETYRLAKYLLERIK